MKRGGLGEENLGCLGFWAFFDLDWHSEEWGCGVTSEQRCGLGMRSWKVSWRRQGEEEGGEVFVKPPGDGESLCLCEGLERNHCKGKQTDGRIWG